MLYNPEFVRLRLKQKRTVCITEKTGAVAAGFSPIPLVRKTRTTSVWKQFENAENVISTFLLKNQRNCFLRHRILVTWHVRATIRFRARC